MRMRRLGGLLAPPPTTQHPLSFHAMPPSPHRCGLPTPCDGLSDLPSLPCEAHVRLRAARRRPEAPHWAHRERLGGGSRGRHRAGEEEPFWCGRTGVHPSFTRVEQHQRDENDELSTPLFAWLERARAEPVPRGGDLAANREASESSTSVVGALPSISLSLSEISPLTPFPTPIYTNRLEAQRRSSREGPGAHAPPVAGTYGRL
jgi:hypothetical protein